MLQCIDQIEVSINERLDHLTILLIDSEQLASLVKDEEKKRNLVKNFRIIKSSEKTRIANEQRYLKYLEKHGGNLNKSQVIACENMLANCINQFLNTDYEAKKAGEITDLVEIFIFYYKQINAKAKAAQLTVIKNCQLFTETNFIQDNIAFFLQNMHQSISHVYETEKNKFFNLTKSENRSLSPERKEEEDEEKFDATGKVSTKDKRKLQLYCYELSKLLDLQSIYLNYFYFNSLDSEKRKRALVSNFLKRNVHIKRIMSIFETDYRSHRERQKK